MAGPDSQMIQTSVGRIIFNRILPAELRQHDPYKGFCNFATTKGDLDGLFPNASAGVGVRTQSQCWMSLRR